MGLSDEQVDYIENLLKENGLSYPPLLEDLLDHVCCAVESKMDDGTAFQVAIKEVLNAFGKDGIEKLQVQTLHLLNQKKQLMKRLSLLTLSVLLFTVTYIFAFPIDPPNSSPLKGNAKITAEFGMTFNKLKAQNQFHEGIDFKVPLGTPVYATGNGVVTEIQSKSTGYGHMIVIKHDDHFESLYAHLSEILIQEGEEIKAGQLIAKVGNSGASLSPHLHYEVKKQGKKINPRDYLTP